jgi:hypothetical protein
LAHRAHPLSPPETFRMNTTSRSLAFLFFACSLVAGAAEPPVVGPAARLSVTPSGEIEIAMADGAVARFVAT